MGKAFLWLFFFNLSLHNSSQAVGNTGFKANSSEKSNVKEISFRQDSLRNYILLQESRLRSKPKVIPVNTESLLVTEAKGRPLKVHISGPIRNRLRKVASKKPKIVAIDSSEIDTVKPGEYGVYSIITYNLTDSGYSVQYGDTLFAPKIIPVQHPAPVSAMPMRYRDETLLDIQYLDVEHGLPSSYVDAIYEDVLGNLWFGTYGGGLTRYDGHTFTTYTEENGLPGNLINSIIEDSSGNLWIGTDGSGLSKFDGSTFTNYSLDQGLASIYVETIIEDKEHNMWFGTNGGGITCYSPEASGKLTNYTTKHGLAGDIVWTSLLDDNGYLWFGTQNGLSRYDGNAFKNFGVENGLPSNNIKSLAQDLNGNLWIGTEGGLCIFDGNRFIIYTRTEGLLSDKIWQINQISENEILIGTDGGGILRIDISSTIQLQGGLNFSIITQHEGLTSDFIKSVFSDSQGNLWFGNDGGGVFKLRLNSFTSFCSIDHLSSNSVWSILESRKGSLWFGCDAWGIYSYINEEFYAYMDEEGVMESSVQDILEDQHGNMWFVTYGGGLILFNGSEFTLFDVKEGFPSNDIYSILEDKLGNIWFGTQGSGLVKYDGTSFTTYNTDAGLTNDRIWTIYEDRRGLIWIGTFGGGLSVFNGSAFINLAKSEGLLNNSVNTIFEDFQGNIWIGTDKGVNKLIINKSTPFAIDSMFSLTTNAGLTNNMVLSFVEDQENNLWIGTEGGITMLSPYSDLGKPYNTEAYKIHRFFRMDGMKGLDAVINSVCLDSENRIWWGTGKGLTMLDLDKFEFNTTEQSPRLTHLQVNDEFIDFNSKRSKGSSDDDNEKLSKILNSPLSLDLPFDQNHITFHYSSIDWQTPHKVQYSYRVLGLDQWSKPSSETKAEYRNMPWGDYTFLIRARSENGVWSKTFKYNFSINSPWWWTWWAKTAWVLVFLGMLRVAYVYRVRSLKAQRKRLRIEVEEKTQEVVGQKEKIEEQANLLKVANEEITRQKESYKTNFEILQALSEVEIDIISTLSDLSNKALVYEKLNQTLTRNLENLLPGESIYFGLYDPDTETIDFPRGMERGNQFGEYSYHIKRNADRLPVRSFVNQVVVFTNNLRKDYPDYPEAVVGELPKSGVHVPLMHNTKAIGVLSVDSYQEGTYNDYHIFILQNLSIYVSAALENVRAFTELEAANKEISRQKEIYRTNHENLRLITDIGSKVISTLSVEKIIERVVSSVEKLLPADTFKFGIYNEDKKTLNFVGSIEKGKILEDFSYHLEHDMDRLAVQCFQGPKVILSNDFEKDYPDYPKSLHGGLPKSVIYVPLMQRTKAVGTLSVSSFEKEAYSYYHITILQNLAVYVSIALENAKNYEQISSANQEISRQKEILKTDHDNLKVLSEIGKEITSTLDLDTVMMTVFERLNVLMDVRSFGIGIYHPEEEIIDYKLAIEDGKKFKPFTRDMKEKNQFPVWCIENNAVVFINDLKNEFHNYIEHYQFMDGIEFELDDGSITKGHSDSMIYVPLVSKDTVLGIVTVQSFKKNAYTEQHVNILKNLANYISIAIENARTFEQLEQSFEQLQELDQYKESMTAMIVHDFKNSLNTVISFSDGTPTERRMKSIRQAGQFMLHMVLNILDVQKFETANVELSLANYPVNQMINKAIEQLSYMMDQKSIKLTYEQSENMYCKVDFDLIVRSIVNILSNAIKYVTTNGSIEISCEPNGDWLRLSIKDDGPGIPEDLVDTVFDKYTQINARKSGAVRSTGIGLTFCKMVVEAHGGKIGVDSKLGQGSDFYFTVPMVVGREPVPEPAKPMDFAPCHELNLSDKDRAILIPWLNRLEEWEVFDYSEVNDILSEIDQENDNIRTWKEHMIKALQNGNEELFNQLLDR